MSIVLSRPEDKFSVPVVMTDTEINLFKERLKFVRNDITDSSYIKEALKVLPVGGYRSAIGLFWNAVIDDLINKVMYRSIEMFNKEVKLSREIKTYEDFQDYVNDDQLIEGAYKIGVIDWEANKVLKHCKETRHIFSGHPKSSDPSYLKVLGMVEDCIKYVLSREYPNQIIEINDYVSTLGTESFDRNEYSVENALVDLPEEHKNKLINRIFTAYIHTDSSTVLKSNIEFISPILWTSLTRSQKVQIARRVDKAIMECKTDATDAALTFIDIVGGIKYLSSTSRKYKLAPLIEELNKNLDEWDVENRVVKELERYGAYIPHDLLCDYINALVQTYVGYIGNSYYASRTDFYADGASSRIEKMFRKLDDTSASIFVNVVKSNRILIGRIKSSEAKLNRLRTLGSILLERISERNEEREFLILLVDTDKREEFYKSIK